MRRPQNLKQSPTCVDKTVVFTFRQNKRIFFSKFCGLFQKSWTLTMNKYIRPNFIEKFQEFCFSTHESTFRLWHVLVENKWQWRLLSSYCGLYAWYSLSTLLSISSCWLLSKTYHIYFTGPWRIHTHPVGAWQGCRNQGGGRCRRGAFPTPRILVNPILTGKPTHQFTTRRPGFQTFRIPAFYRTMGSNVLWNHV